MGARAESVISQPDLARGHRRPELFEGWSRIWQRAGYLGSVCLLVVAYYAAAHLGYAFAFSGPVAAIVWLPVGVGIAFLYLRGLRFWPGVVLGDLLVNNYSALPVGSALGQSFGNLLEVLVAAWLLQRLRPRRDPLATVSGVAGMIVSIGAGTFVSAVIGPVSAWLGGAIAARSLPHVWWTWWLGDFSGALIVVPLALSWSRPLPWSLRRAAVFEAGLTMAAVAGISALALTSSHPIRSLAFPALIWAALRFGSRGATLAITIMSGVAIWAATHFVGPFVVESIGSRVLDTQLFIFAVSLSGLVTVALVSERERLTDSVRRSRTRLVAASDEARRQLERDLHDGAQQGLVAIQFRAAMARETTDPGAVDRQLEAIDRHAGEALDELRDLSHGVYPAVLRDFGVGAALHGLAKRSSLAIQVSDMGIGRCPQQIEAAIYFCVREAIQNAAKHAGAGATTTVTLKRRKATIEFTVSDDGHGMTPGPNSNGVGTINMRDRIAAIGGELAVVSAPGRGTSIHGTIPDPERGTRTRPRQTVG